MAKCSGRAGAQKRYRELLEQLRDAGRVYPCACTRRELADSQLAPDGAHVYPGTCRDGLPPGRPARAWRLRVDDASAGPPQGSMCPPVGGSEPGSRAWGANDLTIAFDDALQGRVEQRLASDVGDFVLLRADGYFAYQLAVVADDADQGITHVVRGADLLDSTARQIFLQRCLGVPTPAYAHLPVVVNALGEKLSKQTLAPPIDAVAPAPSLCTALHFLGQSPPADLAYCRVAEIWSWALTHWDLARVPRRRIVCADY